MSTVRHAFALYSYTVSCSFVFENQNPMSSSVFHIKVCLCFVLETSLLAELLWKPSWLSTLPRLQMLVDLSSAPPPPPLGSYSLSCTVELYSFNSFTLLSYLIMIHTQSYKTGGTPLYWASLRGHIAVVKLLLESGADLNILDEVATHK